MEESTGKKKLPVPIVGVAAGSIATPPLTSTCGKKYHVHEVQIYYEDTDFTGVVYHANYVKFFERAREHLLGPQGLADLYNTLGLGFVVYACELTFKEGARFGDTLEIRTVVEISGQYRLRFDQHVFRKGSDLALVRGKVEMVCVDKLNKLVPIPSEIIKGLSLLHTS